MRRRAAAGSRSAITLDRTVHVNDIVRTHRPQSRNPNLSLRYCPRSLDKWELIRTMRDAYQGMAEAIEHLPDRPLLEPAMDNWTGKDLLAHMAWWHDHTVLVIDGLRAVRQPYDATDPASTTHAIHERT